MGKSSTHHINLITGDAVDAAFQVHSTLGPGLLESAYENCLRYELESRQHHVAHQVPMPVRYRGVSLDCGYRLDLVVDGLVVLELKAVTRLLPLHEAQLLSYLKLGQFRVGLLINFHSPLLRDGIVRMVNGV